MNKPQTERLGVSKLDHFFSSCGWLFREQSVHDHGIDAQVEIIKNDVMTGDLIAIQIKSGNSFFKDETDDAYVFRTDKRHITYWCTYSIPVIIVLYNLDSDIFYWEHINDETAVNTGKGWKINIPKTKILTTESLEDIEQLVQPNPYLKKLSKLQFDRIWIELVENGELVTISFLDWVNKSLSRYRITIQCESRNDVETEVWPTIYGPGASIEETLTHILPWANFEVDEDEHRDSLESDWDAECYMGYDKEDGQAYYTESFDDWYKKPNGIVPIGNDGECEHYRLILSLNKIGKAFLIIDDFLNYEDDFFQRTFNLPEIDPPGTTEKKMI
jgi:hypothetical protein